MVTEVCRFPPTGLPYTGRRPAGGSKELPCVDILRAHIRVAVMGARGGIARVTASEHRLEAGRWAGHRWACSCRRWAVPNQNSPPPPPCFRKLAVAVAGQVLAMKWGGWGRRGSLLERVFLFFCQASSFPSRPNGRCKMGGVIGSTSYVVTE